MNLTLAFCWKEWRAQRSTLVAYAALVFACLCLGLSLAPRHAWFEEGFGAHALSWFVIAGMLGVLFFVAPSLVHGEFGSKDDQFVRRLPGALAPAFRGKLLFLLLATAALPLVGLLLGEVFVTAWGQDWNGLFRWRWDGTVEIDWPGEVLAAGLGLLLAPWIWAIGCWLPRGRMALGATLLLVLALGVGVAAVLRQSPRLENGIPWERWLWCVAPLGLCIAALSWAGRRGGGPLRSARFGLGAMAVGLLPPGLWLGTCAFEYHHPDPATFAALDVQGASPDARFLLARGHARKDWYGPWFRIDLRDGSAERIAGIATGFGTELVKPYVCTVNAQQRYWLRYGEEGIDQRAYDLTTGTWTPIAYDRAKNERHLPADLRDAVLAERRERTPLRAPGGQRVFVEGEAVCFLEPDGEVARVAVPELRGASFVPAGHGLFVLGATNRTFDFTSRRLLPDQTARGSAFLVRGTLVYAIDTQNWRKWGQRVPGGESTVVPVLAECRVFGLYDDDHLLCARWAGKKTPPHGAFLYCPADGTCTPLALPEGLAGELYTYVYIEHAAPLFARGSLLARDPAGGLWLTLAGLRETTFARLDPTTRTCEAQFASQLDEDGACQLLAFDGDTGVLLRQGATIVRFERGSGVRTVVFPR